MTGASQRKLSTRKLLTSSQEAKLTAEGSGTLLYQPTGLQIDGADLTQFFREAHSNHNVTGVHRGATWQVSLARKHHSAHTDHDMISIGQELTRSCVKTCSASCRYQA